MRPGGGQQGLQVLGVTRLPDRRLHLHQVKPGLTELLQSFVSHLQITVRVKTELDGQEKQARALRQKQEDNTGVCIVRFSLEHTWETCSP